MSTPESRADDARRDRIDDDQALAAHNRGECYPMVCEFEHEKRKVKVTWMTTVRETYVHTIEVPVEVVDDTDGWDAIESHVADLEQFWQEDDGPTLSAYVERFVDSVEPIN